MNGEKSDALVFFGATGDLAHKMIFPALQELIKQGKLNMPVIGVAKAGWGLDQLKDRARDSLEKFGGGVDEQAFSKLLSLLRYVDGDYNDKATFDQMRKEMGNAKRPIHYLAIPPSLFPTVIEMLGKSGCAKGARVVIEKPFGHNLKTAVQLNKVVHSVFDESSIYRIDHFLGKEPTQNLLYFRFANSFLEPVWNSNYISCVQITMAENFGIKGRGKFYEETGAIRDVIQNHLLQIAALIAMEPPSGWDKESIRDEKVKVFKSIPPLKKSNVIRGQFQGYKNEDGVSQNSTVETYAAIKFEVDSWRWAGVPFYIRAGKSLPVTATEVLIDFKHPPRMVFPEKEPKQANYVRFRLGPEIQIAIGARTKTPGEEMVGHEIELFVCQHDPNLMPAYERLLGDAMMGDPTLFARQDGVEAAWRIVDPILDNATPVYEYGENSWGPAEAEKLIKREGGWYCPCPSKVTTPV